MANILLFPKSGSDWTENELTAFNIQVDSIDAATFFDTTQLPPATLVSPVILNNERRPQGHLTKNDRLFFHYMKDAETGEESLVDDFAAFVLRMFDFDEPERVIHQRKELSFIMCGMEVDAKPDRGTNRTNPEPQLISGAIAAFYQNNLLRRIGGYPEVDSQTIYGITMADVVPILYRIPVTMELIQYVQAGSYPPKQTIMQRCIPPVPNPCTYPREGLIPLANRVVVMQCFEAFKALVDGWLSPCFVCGY